MRKSSSSRRGISLGTCVMLIVTAAVLAAFFMIVPKLTGNPDIRVDAAKLAVAIDSSLSSLASSAISLHTMPTQQPDKAPTSFTGHAEQPQTTTTPPPALPAQKSFSLCAAGSLRFNKDVVKNLTDHGTYRFDLWADQVPNALKADLSIATLENTTIASQDVSASNMPIELLAALRSTGINALCMGYPGMLNGGITGLLETQQAMQDAGILPYGAYPTEQKRAEMTITDINGVKVALLSYQNELSSAGKRASTATEQGFAYARQQLPVISQDIATVKAAGAQVVIVSLCWGKEGASSPTDTQRELAQSIANAGADIILGTHSGVLQTVEVLTAQRNDGRYHPTLCAYSLGNLFSYEREKRATISGMLLHAQVVYDPSTDCVAFDALSYTPTYSWRGKENGITRQRLLINSLDNYPAFVDESQQGVMQRCYTLVTDVMAGTVIPQLQ